MNAREYWARLRVQLFEVETWIAFGSGGFVGTAVWFAAGGK